MKIQRIIIKIIIIIIPTHRAIDVMLF